MKKKWAYKSQKLKNCIRETQNVPLKKITKMTKKCFTGTFNFHGKKQKTENMSQNLQPKFQYWKSAMKFHEKFHEI